ncbi:MAG TPA: hypothetical protein PLN69_08265 [bacterium]|nr:hypothetical protein [bacterium]
MKDWITRLRGDDNREAGDDNTTILKGIYIKVCTHKERRFVRGTQENIFYIKEWISAFEAVEECYRSEFVILSSAKDLVFLICHIMTTGRLLE